MVQPGWYCNNFGLTMPFPGKKTAPSFEWAAKVMIWGRMNN